MNCFVNNSDILQGRVQDFLKGAEEGVVSTRPVPIGV